MIFGRFSETDYDIVTEGFDAEEVSLEDEALIMEGAMMDGLSNEELEAFLESGAEIRDAVENEVLLERTIVRLDKKAKLSRARAMAIFSIAKEKKDPKFKKLLTLWKLENKILKYLEKKYGTAATSRAKKTINSKKAKSPSVKKAISKAKSMIG